LTLIRNELDGDGAQHLGNILQHNKVRRDRYIFITFIFDILIQTLKKLIFIGNPIHPNQVKYLANGLAMNNVR